MKESVADLYNPHQKTVTFRASEASAALQAAKSLGEEAAFEPRLWRMLLVMSQLNVDFLNVTRPWKAILWDAVIKHTVPWSNCKRT